MVTSYDEEVTCYRLTVTGSNPTVSSYKWKNHIYEMKGDVGRSRHEKEREQECTYTNTDSHSYLHLCFAKKMLLVCLL